MKNDATQTEATETATYTEEERRQIRGLARRYRVLVESGQATLADAMRWDRAASFDE